MVVLSTCTKIGFRKGIDSGTKTEHKMPSPTRSDCHSLKYFCGLLVHKHCSSDLSSGDQSSFDVMVFHVRIVDKHDHRKLDDTEMRKDTEKV